MLDLGLHGFLYAWSITYLGGALVMALLAARLGGRLRPSLPAIRTLAGFGLRAHWGAIAQQALTRFDVYTLNAVVGTRAVGQYSLATTLAERLWMPPAALSSSSVAAVARLAKDDAALLTARVARLSILLMAAMAVPLAVTAPWLLPFVFGRSFAASVTPLAILLPGAGMLGALLVLQNYVFTQLQRPGLLSQIFCADLAVSVPLYLLLISRHGIAGAAVGSTFSYAVAFGAVLAVFCRDSGVPVRRVLLPRPDDVGHVVRLLRRPFASVARVPAGDAQ
jgi:O-antigen/teichoic acid export membrane protein